MESVIVELDTNTPNQIIYRKRIREERVMWDDKSDAKLLKLKLDGLSFAQISERMGISRNAAIGRAQRLAGRVFPSQKLRNERNRVDAEVRNQQVAAERQAATERLKAAIDAGVSRTRAIEKAVAAGATYQTIGDAIGLSKQRVHQILQTSS